jgi:hypothetical protein
VILLLPVPGLPRVSARTYRGFRTFLPLYACLVHDVSLDVIDRLIGLDPDVLALAGNRTTWIPLHHVIMEHKTVSVPLLSRLAEDKLETLLCREVSDLTPIQMALEGNQPATPELASLLEALVRRAPGTVRPTTKGGFRTALLGACRNFDLYPGLLRAVVADCPIALCIKCDGRGLPYDAAADQQSPNLALIEEHTLHVALAVVELALGGAFSPSSSSSWSPLSSSYLYVGGEGPETFQSLVRNTVKDFLAAPYKTPA